ncbi:MAG: PCRF domain-containing protein [Candidatus Campbellbacteria bacterium]|nr:PCRF domain-containing protein [Candidatus Campbellbacteria bacterium]
MSDSKDKVALQKRLDEIMKGMSSPDFWSNKERAQETVREMEEIKAKIEGVGKYDRGNAILHIYSGAGGDDADDFARMLLNMYRNYAEKMGWGVQVLSKSESNIGGIKTLFVEIVGKGAYGTLKSESGVHRLVRTSPFNSKGQRHTSFAMVEVLPVFEKTGEIEINSDDVEIEFSKSSGPGGQNVNKRETAVRVIHKDTGIAVQVSSERSQAQNREKAMQILAARLWEKQEEDRERLGKGLSPSTNTEPEWGSQIRSYVLHPYKMVKDHRTDTEVRNVEGVLEGDIEPFLRAQQ